MNHYTKLYIDGYEEVVHCHNKELGFCAWIAIHNTNRGPALGGCRIWSYPTSKEALADALRLSKAMTYKNALARLPLGGGKTVVNTQLEKADRERLFLEIGNFVETLDGRYIIAEDVNSTVEDMTVVMRRTEHVATVGASGNPSPSTAYGVYCAMKASALHKFGSSNLSGRKVAIQGLGQTGGRLAQLLFQDSCQITGCDINPENIRTLQEKTTLQPVSPEEIYAIPCDIFAPCALGGVINSDTIPLLQCQIIAGSANNQLSREEDGSLLQQASILYAPDFVCNSGGVINISCEIDQKYNSKKAKQRINTIYDTLLEIYALSESQGKPTNLVANELAENLFASPQPALS